MYTSRSGTPAEQVLVPLCWFASLAVLTALCRSMTSNLHAPERDSARAIITGCAVLTVPAMLLLTVLTWLPHGVA
jgi:hypothetical protein